MQTAFRLVPLVLLGALGACQSSDHRAEMSADELEAKSMALGQTGAAHAELAKLAGTWDSHYKMHWAPDQPWMETSGTTTYKSILEGRFVTQECDFTIEGMPFHGMEILGYDNDTGEYTSIWLDSMSTWATLSRGKKDATGTLHMGGTMKDAAGERPFRSVVHRKSNDEMQFEMYDTIPPHGDVLVMTITSKRRR